MTYYYKGDPEKPVELIIDYNDKVLYDEQGEAKLLDSKKFYGDYTTTITPKDIWKQVDDQFKLIDDEIKANDLSGSTLNDFITALQDYLDAELRNTKKSK